jgi:hypothetical protein
MKTTKKEILILTLGVIFASIALIFGINYNAKQQKKKEIQAFMTKNTTLVFKDACGEHRIYIGKPEDELKFLQFSAESEIPITVKYQQPPAQNRQIKITNKLQK